MYATSKHDSDIALQVKEAQIYQLYHQTWGGLAGTFFVALMDVIALWAVIPHWKLQTWLGVMAGLTLIRLTVSIAFKRSQPVGAKVDRWARMHVAGVTCSAMVWAAPAIFLWPSGHPIHQMVWPICIVAVSASAVATFCIWPLSYLPFLLISTPAISFRLLLGGDITFTILAILGIVFCFILAQAGRLMNRASVKTLEVSLSNKLLNDQLRQEIEERQKSQKQIMEANLKTEEANQAKSIFLANMSHEIRTPLNGVIGTALLLKNSPLNTDQRLYVDTLETSSKSLLAIIEDILDFSKIEAGKIELEEVEFDLSNVLDGVVDIMSPKVREKDLELICHLPATIPTLLVGDEGRLRQVLLNLVGNAVKFTSSGYIEISVEYRNMKEGKTQLFFSVRDSGIGVPDELHSQLFKSFTQGDISTTKRFGGTGLGLAISRALVELFEGRIGIENNNGGGAKLWFTGWFGQQSPTGEIAPHSRLENEPKFFLLIDDSPHCLELLRRRLTEQGGRVLQATNVSEALPVIDELHSQELKVDALFIDLSTSRDHAFTRDLLPKIANHWPLVNIISMLPLGSTSPVYEQIKQENQTSLRKPIQPGPLRMIIEHILSGEPLSEMRQAAIAERETALDKKLDVSLLLAEDNSINQLVITRMLSEMGYHDVDAVNNGVMAVAALQRKNYSLILMDIQMPELDGMETTQRIRAGIAGPQNTDIPIIALTANAIKGDRERYLDIGMNDYITKPVDPGLLRSTLQHFIDGPSPASPGGKRKIERPPNQDLSDLPPYIDFTSLVEKLSGDQEFAGRVVNEFLDIYPSELHTLKTHIREENLQAAGEMAHKLKGMTANICATALFQLFDSMETAARAGEIDETEQLFAEVVSLSERLEK